MGKITGDKGFTLIEMVISIALLAIVIGVSISYYSATFGSSSAESAAVNIIDQMRILSDNIFEKSRESTGEVGKLSELTSGDKPIITSLPNPPKRAKDKDFNLEDYKYSLASDDYSNYSIWASSLPDTVIVLPGVTENVCKRINESLFNIETINTTVDGKRDFFCWNNSNTYIVVKLVYPH